MHLSRSFFYALFSVSTLATPIFRRQWLNETALGSPILRRQLNETALASPILRRQLNGTTLAAPILRRQFNETVLSGVEPVVEAQSGKGVCTERLHRKAWHTLTADEKKAYIDAELCLMWHIPSKTGLEPAHSRFDDFIKVHQRQANVIHNTGWFLPFHRFFVHAHEKMLRDECGYTGAQPYWDETLDVGNFRRADILNAEDGFGGDGRRGLLQLEAGCIEDGPFANYTLHVGPGFIDTEHCITRDINERRGYGSRQSNIDECLEHDTFEDAWPCIEDRPHNGGHGGIGGEMSNPVSSPGDPLFYMHHAFIDRIWWQWQQKDLPNRLEDIAGYTTHNGPVLATLDDDLTVYGIVPDIKIRDIMDLHGDINCAEYD